MGLNPGMMKRALVVLAGLFCLGQSLPAQVPFGASLFDQPYNSPWSFFDSQDRFSFSTGFGSMRRTPEYLPAFNPSEPLSAAYLAPDNKRSVDRVADLQKASDLRWGGEIGFLYGRSTGSGYGRQDFAGYIIGTVGNDKFSITASYSHQETTFSGSGWRR
jgi:hypothetical protein